MPVDLHQRLSEFSYGYGVTREIERRLEARGIHLNPPKRCTPKNPSSAIAIANKGNAVSP